MPAHNSGIVAARVCRHIDKIWTAPASPTVGDFRARYILARRLHKSPKTWSFTPSVVKSITSAP